MAHKVLILDQTHDRAIHIGYIDRNQAARIVNYLGKYKYSEKVHHIVARITDDNPGGYNEVEMLGLVSMVDSTQYLLEYRRNP